MIKKRLVLIITIIIALILFGLINLFNIRNAESKGLRLYAAALENYHNGQYEDAYSKFARISGYSTLKPAAIFRQATCAEHLKDTDSAIKNYKRLYERYPQSNLALKSRYECAKNIYKSPEYKNKQKAASIFANIIKKYPQSEYAVASHYYLGLLEVDKLVLIKNNRKRDTAKSFASDYFRFYLKEAPSGRYAFSAINELKELNGGTTNDDNLLIARVYYSHGDYKTAQNYLNLTNVENSWIDIVKNAYELRDVNRVKSYTELGLSKYSNSQDIKDIYKVIDLYLNMAGSKSKAVSYLLTLTENSNGSDYVNYLNCKYSPQNTQMACCNTYYYKYPSGQFSADILFNIFYDNVKNEKYIIAKRLGREHLRRFSDTNSAPAVMYWMGKISERTKNYEEATSYYKATISKFPDSYYAYRAYLRLNRIITPLIKKKIVEKPLVFPYKRSLEGNLVVKLAMLKDYALIDEICKNDKFVQSWIAHQKGEYSRGTTLARDAMNEMTVKPNMNDLRWRLVYPIIYYDWIKNYAKTCDNNPIIILSIVREESYFNPNAKSIVGAKGLMQLMPATANEVKNRYGIISAQEEYLYDPQVNIKLGNLYYQQLRNMLDNKDLFAILAYNGGIGSVKNWKSYINYTDFDEFLEQVPYDETKNYLKKVMSSYWNYSRIYND